MKNIINIGNCENAVSQLTKIRDKKYSFKNIEITNVHLLKLNKVCGYRAFKKDNLIVDSDTLWEIMRPVGGRKKHHFHGLLPTEVYEALLKLCKSKDIFESYNDRFKIITIALTSKLERIVVIIEVTKNPLGYTKRGTNRLVTMFPTTKK